MAAIRSILIIGATGMLGRPVVRRLIKEGFLVRAMVRDVPRASTKIHNGCELVPGDLKDGVSICRAMDGIDAVYVNLAKPMRRSPPPWSPEVDGVKAIIAAMKKSNVSRLLRISAMGVDDAAATWWAAKAKADADRLVMDSGLAWTVFRPTWFMESICTLKLRSFMMCPDLPDSPLRWIAGDDYARQVTAALRDERATNQVYQPQGPELLTIKAAVTRFIEAWTRKPLRLLPTPLAMMRLGKPFSGKAHYLASLMDMTRDHFARIDREAISTNLPPATMKIEDYAKYVERTGDWPRK